VAHAPDRFQKIEDLARECHRGHHVGELTVLDLPAFLRLELHLSPQRVLDAARSSFQEDPLLRFSDEFVERPVPGFDVGIGHPYEQPAQEVRPTRVPRRGNVRRRGRLTVVQGPHEPAVVDQGCSLAGVTLIVKVDRSPALGVRPIVDDRHGLGPDHGSQDRLEIGAVTGELVGLRSMTEGFVGERAGVARVEQHRHLSRGRAAGVEQLAGTSGHLGDVLLSEEAESFAASQGSLGDSVELHATIFDGDGCHAGAHSAKELIASGAGRIEIESLLVAPNDAHLAIANPRHRGRPRLGVLAERDHLLGGHVAHRTCGELGPLLTGGRGDPR